MFEIVAPPPRASSLFVEVRKSRYTNESPFEHWHGRLLVYMM
jgi:hypothetical protein